jgi:ATP-dependent helicase HrpB
MDRVAQRKKGRELVLENGTQATLDEASCVVSAPLLLALSANAPGGRSRKASVRIACRLDADWLLDVLTDRIDAIDELVFDVDKERVDQVSRLVYGKLTLDESRQMARPSRECARILVEAALDKGPRVFDPEGAVERLFVRLQLLWRYFPKQVEKARDDLDALHEWGAWGESGPDEVGLIRAALGVAATHSVSLVQLRELPLAEELLLALPSSLQEALRTQLPQQVVLKGGRRLDIHYEKGREPWIESRLQDFFGMTDGPSICGGRVPLQIHFLAPNQRALQVTTDLPGFWERHYPDLRRQLMRRYPKHLWPEDGRTAKPPQPGRIR